ncbi:MAG: hypothetical protein ACRYG2_31575 [Janthinobacterium lividum]
MDLHPLEPALVAVAAFVLIVYRQLRAQPVSAAGGARRPLVLAVVGLFLAGQYVLHHTVTTLGVVGLVVSLAVAAVLAFLRGRSVRLWRQNGTWWRRGTAPTLVLWFCSIGTHLGVDALVGVLDPTEGIGKGLGNATLLLYLGVSLGLQHLVVQHRVRTLPGQGVVAPVEAPTRKTSRLAG